MTEDARIEGLLAEVIATRREHMERFERHARETEDLQRKMAENQATFFHRMTGLAVVVVVVALLFLLLALTN